MSARPEPQASLQCVVRGRVQGVGFRAFVEMRARSLELAGYVRNRPDGSVEIVAAGELVALERLLAECRTGPPGAHVSDAAVHWGAEAGDVGDGFEVRF